MPHVIENQLIRKPNASIGVTALTGCNEKLAVAASDGIVSLYEPTQLWPLRDKFSIKRATDDVSVSHMQFCQDGSKLAVVQTDCRIYIYRLGVGF